MVHQHISHLRDDWRFSGARWNKAELDFGHCRKAGGASKGNSSFGNGRGVETGQGRRDNSRIERLKAAPFKRKDRSQAA